MAHILYKYYNILYIIVPTFSDHMHAVMFYMSILIHLYLYVNFYILTLYYSNKTSNHTLENVKKQKQTRINECFFARLLV